MINKKMSRRAWLKGIGQAGIGSLVLGRTWRGIPAEAAEKEAGKGKVPTRPFGKTGVDVSVLSLGGMFDIPNNQLLLRQALEWGVTYWDTADCYGGGNSEEGIGKFFSRRPDKYRKQVFLVTKSDERDPEGMTWLLKQSLERMKTNYIDLYFLHAVSHISELNDDTRKWAEKAKAEGKIKFFGFSTHRNMEDCMLAAAKLGWIDGMMLTYNYHLMHTEKMKAAVAACVDAGIGLTAMKTQGGGPGPAYSESETELALTKRFMRRGFTDKQAKLKAVWENPNIASVCSQMPNLTILMSNVAAALDKTTLSQGDRRLLEQYAREKESTYCAGCGALCESALSEDIPISDIMRSMMYYHHYTDQDEARREMAGVTVEMLNRIAEVDFSPAETQCPRKLRISSMMKEAVSLLS